MSARLRVLWTIALATSPAIAHAQEGVGVVVTGDATSQAPTSAMIKAWLEQHGRSIDSAALTPDAINQLSDCFVMQDLGCARQIAAHAHAPTIVFARIEASGTDRKIAIYWFDKGREPTVQRSDCKQCNNDALNITVGAMLFTLAGATPAPAPPAATPAPASVTVEPSRVTTSAPTTSPAATAAHGLAVGAELGEPTSATLAYFIGALTFGGAIGTGTVEGAGVSAHADVQLVVTHLSPSLPVRVGLGLRYYHQGYQPMSIDEVPDSHYGARASATLAYQHGPLELYGEVAPGIDFVRTPSCTLADGPNSICPHAMAGPFFFQLVVGARWFLSH